MSFLKNMMKGMSRNALNLLLGLIFVGFVSINHAPAADGKTVFKKNCAACHALTDTKITGPGIKGGGGRCPKQNDWLFHWIKNNEKLIKSGDAYANKIFKDNGNTAMTVFENLSDDEIKAVEAYILNPPVEQKVAATGGAANAGGGEGNE